MALYTKINGVWKGVGNSWTPTLSFNSNGGSGAMSSYTGFGKFTTPACAFSRSGYLFTGWNTAPDGSGASYSPNDQIELAQDTTLYAQWIVAYTLSYKHTNKTNLMGSDHTGHMECYALYINGVEQPDLGTFAENRNPSYTLPHGTTIRVVVSCYNPNDTLYNNANCDIIVNGMSMSRAPTAEWSFSLTSNATIEFQWRIAGSVVTLNAQSWEDCYITTY